MNDSRSNSSAAFAHISSTGALGEAQSEVLAALRKAKRPVTGRELAHHKRIDGAWKRLPELERAGAVRRCGSIKCSVTGRKATTWVAL